MIKFIRIFSVSLILCVVSVVVQARPIPASFADLAETVTPSVVNISSTKFPDIPQQTGRQGRMGSPFSFQFDFGQQGAPPSMQEFFDEFFGGPMPGFPNMDPGSRSAPRTQSMGSGFVIDAEKGYVITNNHVIDGADEIKVTLQDDVTLAAEIVGRDEKTDLAVLKVDPTKHNLTEVVWGNSDVMRVGDWVMAVGNPFGLGGTVTAGIISARQRNINAGPYDDFLQTDASINRGNSGGPMFNMAGEVIGINTAIFSPTGGSVGIGFAIPSDLAKTVIDQLIEFGATKRGWLGVQIQEVTEDIAESLGLDKASGALIASVAPDGPAEKAGLKAGDVIVTFDGQEIDAMHRLPRVVAETDVDKKVTVHLWREGRQMTKAVILGQLEKAEKDGLLKTMTSQDDDASELGNTIDKLGFDAAPLDDNLRHQFGLSESIKGLVVMDIDTRSDAADKLSVGDIIVEANQKPVTALDDLNQAVQMALEDHKKTVLLLVNTLGNLRFTAVKIMAEDQE